MTDPMTSNVPAAKRGLDRDSLLLKAVLRFPRTKDEGEVRIRNLSAGGLMAETPARVTRGELVEIHLRSIGWISGHVAWVTEGRLGIAFDHAINPKDARKPVGTSELEIPSYLKKLNNPAAPSKLRRL
jgi:PilZ domain